MKNSENRKTKINAIRKMRLYFIQGENALDELEKKVTLEDGKAHIGVDLTGGIDNCLSDYSAKKTLDEAAFSYIEGVASPLSGTKLLAVDFVMDKTDKGRESLIVESYRNHYKYEFSSLSREKRKNNISTISFFALGLAFLFAYVMMTLVLGDNITIRQEVFAEVLSTVSCVFLWESVSNFAFNRKDIRARLEFISRLALADIYIFSPGEKRDDAYSYKVI